MVPMNAVLLATLPTAVEKNRDPVHCKRLFQTRSNTTRIQVLTPPTEMSAFTLFLFAVETNLVKSSSPPETNS
jgi:hypothetical protein